MKKDEYTIKEIIVRVKKLPRYAPEKFLKFEDVRNLLWDIQKELGDKCILISQL